MVEPNDAAITKNESGLQACYREPRKCGALYWPPQSLGQPAASRRETENETCCQPDALGEPVFSQTETCLVLSLVNGSRFQPLQRSRSVIPASRAIRSSSEGHT
jgi:hypothetical protein